jgi:hypothetical protein
MEEFSINSAHGAIIETTSLHAQLQLSSSMLQNRDRKNLGWEFSKEI